MRCCPSIHSCGDGPASPCLCRSIHSLFHCCQVWCEACTVSLAALCRGTSILAVLGINPCASFSLSATSNQLLPPFQGARLSAMASSSFQACCRARHRYQCVAVSSASLHRAHLGEILPFGNMRHARHAEGSAWPRVLKAQVLSSGGSLCAEWSLMLVVYHWPETSCEAAKSSMCCFNNFCWMASVKSASIRWSPSITQKSSPSVGAHLREGLLRAWLAAWSANSLPAMPTCALTHFNSVVPVCDSMLVTICHTNFDEGAKGEGWSCRCWALMAMMAESESDLTVRSAAIGAVLSAA